MNKAEKRTWYSFAISLLTILGAAGVILFIRAKNVDIHQPGIFRTIGIFCTIPLILMVILAKYIPGKEYDERDKQIERRAMCFGYIGGFVFLCGAAWLLAVIYKLGLIRVSAITTLVYLAYFITVLVASAAALIQYGLGNKGEKL